jgi:hypothetical protein
MNEDWSTRNIQAHMAQIRKDVDQAVGEIAVQVQDMKQQLADWRYYVRRYPWIVAAGAAAVGYLIVPTRASRTYQADPESLAALSRGNRLTIQQKPSALRTLSRMGLEHLSSLALRSATAYMADSFRSAPSRANEPKEW